MKKFSLKGLVALLLILIGAAIVVMGFLPQRATSAYDLTAFGKLPVQFGTRVLPVDSVARNTMRLLSERTAIYIPDVNSREPDAKILLPANQWFLELAFRPENAERAPVFSISHDDVLGLIGQQQKGNQRFSFLDLTPYFDKIEKAASEADDRQQNEQPLSLFDSEIMRLRNNLVLFQRLSVSFVPPSAEPLKDWDTWQNSLKAGAAAVLAKDSGKSVDQNVLDSFTLQVKRFMQLDSTAVVGLVPQAKAEDKWSNLGHAALEALRTEKVSPILRHYGEAGEALRKDDPTAFNAAVAALQHDLDTPQVSSKVRFEAFMNNVEPFFRGSFLYMMAFLCACISWVAWGPELRRAAVWLMIFGLMLHTLGLFARVYLTGYGVVTSLLSALQFMGWIAVVAGLIMEMLKRRGVGAAAASFVGFATLVVANSLPFGGDDLELPRAVLATNFWLWTHVTCINIGCGAMFVAGALGIGYILAGTFSSGLTTENRRLLSQFVYGVTCFATLFSFVGTMLGGIWADQSWGRFWGWDPKENGALMIVLWCAICLHARWGKVCSERTQMALAVGGNMVTAWTLFGVNLLGVGLHSYGFMQGTFYALVAFWISQLVIIGLALLPLRFWKSQPAQG